MVEYKFLENDRHLLESFYLVKGRKIPKLYLIVVGAFEDNELKEILMVGKPPTEREYTFKLLDYYSSHFLFEMKHFFHNTYDGKIEGIE